MATVERLSRTIGQMVTFSVPQPLRVQSLPLGACLTGIEALLAPALGHDVRLTVRSDPDAGAVAMDADLLQQAVLHLAANAREAMPHGGTLTIAAQRARL